MNLALFDLDHTLLPIDSDYSWGEFTTRLGWTDPVAFKAKNDQFYADYQTGVLDIHDYVRFATSAVKLRGADAAAKADLRNNGLNFSREAAFLVEASSWCDRIP
jgi:phosphoserine phosphatase